MNKKQWFESWFDTTYYHTLYKHRDNTEAQRFISHLMQHLSPDSNCHILDLACGKGRHSIFLNSLGYEVTGLDLSKESIAHASRFANETLHFDVHDLREVYEGVQFDYIFNLFTSFGYFGNEADNYNAIDAMAKELKEDGVLVIDFMNSFKSAFNLIEKEVKTIDGIDFRIKRYLDGKTFVKKIEFVDNEEHFQFEERVQGLTHKDFEKYCQQAGLEIIDTFGSYELDYFSKNTSDRLILLIKKTND